jgi:hypothetical protein
VTTRMPEDLCHRRLIEVWAIYPGQVGRDRLLSKVITRAWSCWPAGLAAAPEGVTPTESSRISSDVPAEMEAWGKPLCLFTWL